MGRANGVEVRAKPSIPAAGDPKWDPRWELVDQICNGSQLRRSARLRELLIYLCHRAWVDGAQEIREQEIGGDVFARSPGYDPAQETIVRVQASQLRKRLEQYFAGEGRHLSSILDIPRGGYIPQVKDRLEVTSSPAVVPQPRDRKLILFLAGTCLLLATACAWLVFRQNKPLYPVAAEPSLSRFWSAFSAGDRETYIVVADAAISAVQDALRRPIGIDEYVRRGYKQDLNRPEVPPQMKDLLAYLMERRYTSLADVMLVRRLSMSAVLDPKQTSIVFARDHNLRAFHNSNHILVGSRRAVPWVDLFEEKLSFHFKYDEANRRLRVENRKPQRDEPATFILHNQGVQGGESFSLIAYLPNLSRNGHVLILSGQEMSGTEAAGNLVTTEVFLKDLLSRLPEKPGGEVPHFEVLLRTRHVEYTSQGFEILALHLQE